MLENVIKDEIKRKRVKRKGKKLMTHNTIIFVIISKISTLMEKRRTKIQVTISKNEIVANPNPISSRREDGTNDVTKHCDCASSPYASSHLHFPFLSL